MSDPAARPLPPDPVIEAYKRDVDRTLLRENLRLTWEERLLALQQLQELAAELGAAGQRLRGRA
ncbi:MAG: hypothetical protein ACK6DP_01760 [Gemmatimonas sp.]|jgi:hypothetical protein|uniref:hypothetical protein n=1 Tax=Gemmatimonas sp. TaxID=1962908 RepID=UPI00391F70BB|nr:hypothetical protein [Gemmatimonadota bacterium]